MSRKQLSTTKINIAENTLIQRFPWAYQTSTELVNIEELPVLWREISCSSVTSEWGGILQSDQKDEHLTRRNPHFPMLFQVWIDC